MDDRLIFRYRSWGVDDGGTEFQRSTHDRKCGAKVEESGQENPARTAPGLTGRLQAELTGGASKKILGSESHGCPYCNLTQVGEESILRRSREPSLRNSAKWFRNFGIRIAWRGVGVYPRSHAPGRRESPPTTVYQKHRSVQSRQRRRIQTDACPLLEG